MAESYRGLTIRIGGDTTKLTKALGVANSTISGTQSEIRKLDQALKLDPSNIEAFNLKMGYMEQQATAAAMKLYQLQKAAEEVGQREVSLGDDRESVQTVEQLAKATENAHLQAQQLKAAYNQVKDSLAEMYTELTGYNEKAAKQISETMGSDLAESIGVNSTPEAIQGFVDSLTSYFNDLNGVIKKPKKSIEEVSAELQRLRKEYSVTDSDSKKLKIQEQFEKLRDEITQFQGLTINFEEGKTDIKDIEHTIEQLDKLGSMGFDTEQIEAYKQEVSRLKVAYVETLDELKKANEVARFADLQVEIEKAKASVKGLAKALADMREPSQLMRGMADLTEQADALQTSYKGLASDAKSLESAFGINPGNTEAQAAAMKAWSDAELVATERAAALREQIDQFDREKIDGYADATKSVQQQLIDASVAHANAEEKVSAYKGAIEATVYALRQLDLNASETAKILEKLDPDNSKMHENAINGDAAARAEYKQWLEGLIDRLRELNEEEAESGNGEALEERRKMISAAQDLANALDGLTEAERNEAKTSEGLEYAKQRRDLEGLDSDLLKTTGDIDNARVAMQRLAAAEIKPHVDTTEIDKLKDVEKTLKDYGSSMGRQLNDMANDISVLNPIVDGLSKRATDLMAAFASDPENIDALELGMHDIDEATAGCTIRAEKLREIISGYEDAGIGEVAAGIDNVDLNAERAANRVSELSKQIDKATKEANEFGDEYAKALKSAEGNAGGADNPHVAELLEQYKAATARVNELTEAERRALQELNTANAVKELVAYREELARVDTSLERMDSLVKSVASSVAKTTTSNFTETVFGGFDERLGTFDSAMSTIQNRVKVMGDAMKVFPDTTELAKRRMVELAEAVSVGESETRNLEDIIKSIESDVGDGGFDMFEGLTGTEALDSAERRVESIVVQIDAMRHAMQTMGEDSRGFAEASVRVEELEKELAEARKESVLAAAYQKWEEYNDRLASVRVTVQGLKNDLYGMGTNVLDEAVKSVEEIKSAFGESRMPDFARQFEGLNDVIEDAKRRIVEIDNQISKGFADDGAFEERAQQVTRLLNAIEQQAQLTNKTMADFGLDSKADELTKTYGGVEEAIGRLSEKVIATAGSMEVLTNQARQFASQHDLGEQWLEDFTKLRLSIDDVPEEIQAVYESMQRLSGSDLDNRIDLGIATQIKYLQDLGDESKRTFQSIRQDASQKIRLDVDDTAVKNIRTMLKDATGSAFDTNNLGEYSSRLSYIEAALKGVSDTANDLKERVKFDPANATLMATATDAFRQKVVLLNERLTAAKQLMAQFESSGVKYASLSMAELATRTEASKQKVEQLDDIAGRLGDAIKEAAEEFDRLNDAGKDTSKVKAQLDALEDGLREVREAAGEAAQEVRELTQAGEYRDLGNVVATTGSQIRETNDAAKELGDGFKNAFGTATMQAIQQIGQAAERVASEVIESANTIDAAYRDMRKTVNGTEAEFGALLDSAIQFSQTHAVTADTILEMEALGGQLGITVDKLQEFGEVASNLDIATDIGAEDIALQLGQITNLMSDLDYDTFENFGDALVRLGNNMPTTESAIMDVAQRMAAVANVTNMSTPDLLAWSAAIASTGQRSESAATAINKTITGIGTAVATGGETLNQFAAIANMSAEQFEEAWKSSSSDTLEAFVKGLAELTDDSTAAIQALESVGVTGVRQETALLSLSQTIQNLDNATMMATNAFNGVSDGWGKAGDAANEANNKSQGFSGTLQILKNNASALAASLGDALVEPMKLAANIIGMVTDALNSLGGPAKTAVVLIGGLSAVVGTTLPAIKELAEGWEKFAASSATVQTASSLLTVALANLSDALGITAANTAFAAAADDKEAAASLAAAAANKAQASALIAESVGAGAAEVATKLFSKALMAVPGAAVIVALSAAFAILVDTIGSAVKRTGELDKLARATMEAGNAAKTLKDSYGKAVGEINVQPAKQSLQELRDETSALISDLTEFENSVSDIWKSLGSDSAYIDEYASKIKEIGNSGGITEERLAELKNAVAKYNEMTGASVKVINDQTGALNLTSEALDEVTDAYKRQAEAKAYADLYNETIKKQIEIKEELSEAQDRLNALTEKYGVDLGNGSTWMLWYYNEAKELESQIDVLSSRQVNYNKRLKEYSEHMNVASGETLSYEAAVVGAGIELETFNDLTEDEKESLAKVQSKLIEAGDSLKNYGDLNVEQVRAILEAWDGTAQSVQDALDAMADGAKDSLDTVVKATDEQYNHIKDLYDQLATEQKRIRDDYETREKRELDAEYERYKQSLDRKYEVEKQGYEDSYTNAKNSYDDIYNARKDELDREADLYKQTLDDEYTARKDQLDKELDLYKQSLDDIYNARKDALDKEEEAYKQSLDDSYNARKDELDKETDLYKDFLDDQYNARKDELDREVDAYKKHLDSLYNALKAELDAEYSAYKSHLDGLYNARKSVLSKEYDTYKKQLSQEYDARKDVLDNEYNSMKKASDKWLSQYKKTLDREVDAFKDATSARLDLLKDEYNQKKKIIDLDEDNDTKAIDDQINAIKAEQKADDKARRDAERQEKLNELNTKLANAKTKKSREKAQKDLNDYLADLYYEDMKEQRDAAIEKLQDQKDIIKDEADYRQEQLKASYDAAVKSYESMRSQQIEIMQEANSVEYESAKELEEAKLKAKKDANDKELELLKEIQDAQLAQMKEQNDADLESVKEQNDFLLGEMKSQHDAQLEAAKDRNDAELDAIKSQNEAELKGLKRNNDALLEAMKSDNEAELLILKRNNDAMLEVLKDQHEAELLALKRNNDTLLDNAKADNEAALLAFKRNNEVLVENLKNANDAELLALKRDNDAQLTNIKRQNDAELEIFKNNQDALLLAKKQEQEDHLTLLKRLHEDELSKIKNGYDATLRALKDGTISYADVLEQITGKAVEDINKISDAANNAVDKEVNESAKTAADRFTQTMSAVSEAVSGTEGQLAKTAQGMLKNGQITLQQYLGLINGSAHAVSSSVASIFQQSGIELGNGLGAIAQQMLANEQITLQEYLNIINGVPGAASAVCNETGLAIANELGLIQPSVKASSQGVADGIKAPFDALPGYMKDVAVPNTANAIASELGSNDTVDKLGRGTGAMYNAVTKKWESLSKEGSTYMGATTVNDVVSGVVEESSKASGALNPLYENMSKEFIATSKENSPKVGGNATNDIAKGMADNKEPVEKAAEAVAFTGLEAFSKKGKDYEKAGTANVNSYNTGLGKGGEKSTKTVGAIGDGVVKTLDRKDSLKIVGVNTIVGFINGMVESFNNQGNSVVANIADSIISTFAGRMKVHSPSRVFEWIAEMDALGFINEWGRQSRHLVESVGDVADDMVNEMSSMSFEQPELTFDISMMDREYAAFKDMLERREQLLREHAARMEELSKTIGDIQLPMAAAYDAMGRINTARAATTNQSTNNVDNRSYAPVININIPEVVVREQADIKSLSEQIARKVRRELTASLG